MSLRRPPAQSARRPPYWVTWSFAVPGVLALSIAVTHYTAGPTGNLAVRLRFACLAVVLLGLAGASSALAARRRNESNRKESR